MNMMIWVWCGILAAITVGWLYLLWELFYSNWSIPMLRAGSVPPSLPRWPSLSIIVPAMNEEENIERCLRHILAQDYAACTGASVEIVVVDDRSSDQTAAKARRVLDEAPPTIKTQLLQATSVPEGWAGKPNAMRMAVEATQGERAIFLDADTCLRDPSALRIAVADATQSKCALHTLIPVLELETFWDKLLQPVLSSLFLLVRNPRRANDPRSRTALGCGMYMAWVRESLIKMGGLEAVKGCLNEDLWLARICKDQGFPLRVANQKGLVTSRMYRGLASSYRGWSRIMQASLLRTELLLLCSTIPFFALGPCVSLLCALVLWPETRFEPMNAGGWIAAAAGAAVVSQCIALIRYYRMAGLPAFWVATYPAAVLVGCVMLVDAFQRKLRGASVTWRGAVCVDRPPHR